MSDTLIAYLHPNEVGFNFHTSLQNLILADRGRYVADVRDIRCGPGGLDHGRNAIAATLLDSDLEWLLMVDADMGFQPDALHLLRSVADPVDRPVVGGLCFAQRELAHDGRAGYRWQPKPTIFDRVDLGQGPEWAYRHHYPVNSLVRCDGTGGAFVLIHRSVLDRLGSGWFSRIPDRDGLMSEDLSFFTRCHAAGIPCFIHTGVRTNHLKETWISEVDFWQAFDPPPAVEQVDVIVPVLHRPQNVRPFMESLRASTGLATAWFVCDRGDREEQDEVLACGGQVLRCDGTFAEKANYAHGKTRAPWIFLAGDDVQFRPGWLDHAQFAAAAYEGHVIGTNDLGNPRVTRGDHATHMLIRRSYIDEVGASWDGPGVVCHEGYGHWYVDDEIVTAAQQRGVWQMALGSIVEHMHPAWGKAADDAVYQLGQSQADDDRATFEARLARV